MRSFTLIEVLIYMSLLAVLISGIIETYEGLYVQLLSVQNQALGLEEAASANEAARYATEAARP